jgi:heme-binding protein
VEEGHMPLWYYVLLHPEAKLSVEDKEIIKKWSEGRL